MSHHHPSRLHAVARDLRSQAAELRDLGLDHQADLLDIDALTLEGIAATAPPPEPPAPPDPVRAGILAAWGAALEAEDPGSPRWLTQEATPELPVRE